MGSSNFEAFRDKMLHEGLPEVVISTFEAQYAKLREGAGALIRETEIEPVTEKNLARYRDLGRFKSAGEKALSLAVVIKLNGGLGTSMGLASAKSLIEAKNGLSFLEIALRQIGALNRKRGTGIPFIAMDSFHTQLDALPVLRSHREIDTGFPLSFLQHKYPKIVPDTFAPAQWPANRQLEWNPPGHGDIYAALVTSGILESLTAAGIRYAFISNIDNLGASLDPGILGYFAESGFSFMMEVTQRTSMDNKGGHIARAKNGKLLLRESAQCHDDDKAFFSDIDRHRYFNTNNLWIDLVQLRTYLSTRNQVALLPVIKNIKHIDPSDFSSPKVIQLETAMGSAISLFDSTAALEVPRDRFVPVKKCTDLLVLWSDRYELTDDFMVRPAPGTAASTVKVELDESYYAHIAQFRKRIARGAPSLKECRALSVRGDVGFGAGVVLKGVVSIRNQSTSQHIIPDGTVIQGDLEIR